MIAQVANGATFRTIVRPKPVVQRMADVLVALNASNGGVTENELRAQFSAHDIRSHFDAARRLADKAARQ